MSVVLDASALLASLRGEPGATRVDAVINGAIISTVNLAEVAGHFARAGNRRAEVDAMLAELPIESVAPDRSVALEAGMLRAITDKAELSLGDRFCLAQAKAAAAKALTADRAWAELRTKLGIEIEVIR